MAQLPAPSALTASGFRIGEPLAGIGPLAVRVAGTGGPWIVLIHGLGRVAAAWGRVAEATGAECRLVLPDNPGLGRSSHLPVPRSIEGHARLHAETLENLGAGPAIHLAGLSLGGMIAPVLASRLGARCASLTLFSTSSRETGFWRLDPFSLLRMAGRVIRTLSIDHRVNMPELVRPSVLANEPGLSRILDKLQKAEGFSARAGFQQLVAAARFKIGPYVTGLPARKLVAVGTDDLLVPPSHSRRLAHRIAAPLLEIPGAAHDLGLDAPSEVARILLAMAHGEDPRAMIP
jgi:pimeloyl-ACP methyl ester carboxylesterase